MLAGDARDLRELQIQTGGIHGRCSKEQSISWSAGGRGIELNCPSKGGNQYPSSNRCESLPVEPMLSCTDDPSPPMY